MNEPTIDLLDEVWTSISGVCDGLTEEEWVLPTGCPGWTVKDQVAHMIGTERMLLGEQPPAVAADVKVLPHVRNDIGAFNEAWVEGYRSSSGRAVLDEFRTVTARRLAQLRSMTDEEWEREGFTPEGPGPYRKFMAIRAFDCWVHEHDIREAVDRSVDFAGPLAELAMAKLFGGMAYVVGKKASCPQGSTVVFSVSGPAGFERAIGVDGRAGPLDHVPAKPTVRLRMDDRTFVRLACGRALESGVQPDRGVIVEGDEELGRAIFANMGFTI